MTDRAQAAYDYESGLCHHMMFAAHGGREEQLAAVLQVLVRVAMKAKMEHVAFFAEQALMEFTGLDDDEDDDWISSPMSPDGS